MKSLKSRRRVRRGLLTAMGSAAVGNAVGALVAALLIEPRWIHVTRPTVWLPDLPEGWDGLRIAHLTDLHHGRMVRLRLITEAVRLANAESPDLVVLTGDFVSRPGAITTALAKALSKLQAPLGSYAVLGNHDHSADAGGVREMLAAAGVRLLENSHVLLARGGDLLAVAGVDDLWFGVPHLASALRDVPPEAGRLLLCHNPAYARRMPPVPRVDLMISGHTHGGQVRLPLLGRPGQLLRLLAPQEGLLRRRRCPVYVSRGIGMVGLPVRFNCRPELPIITLRSKAES